MAREMTPQERAEEQYTMNDLFRMAMDGKVNIVEDKFVYASALQQTRRAALLEARQAISKLFDENTSSTPEYYCALLDAGNALDRLASEGG